MKIAIVGAGLAGLGVAWHLLQYPNIEVTLYDEGKSASKASTGLLYPFPGRTSARSWLATEGMAASLALIEEVEAFLGKPVAHRGGVLRLPWIAWQKANFVKIAKKDPTVSIQNDALWVPSGMAVYSKLYLDGLLKLCLSKGAVLKRERVEDLPPADHVILAAGSESLHFADLPLERKKGHALLCRWGKHRLPYSLVANGHITPTEDPDLCFVGSTYESDFTSPDPDPAVAPLLLEKAALFYPPAKDFEVVDILAGIRMTAKDGYRPTLQKLNAKTHIFTGLGSRGLLYHAVLGKRLAEEISLSNF